MCSHRKKSANPNPSRKKSVFVQFLSTSGIFFSLPPRSSAASNFGGKIGLYFWGREKARAVIAPLPFTHAPAAIATTHNLRGVRSVYHHQSTAHKIKKKPHRAEREQPEQHINKLFIC